MKCEAHQDISSMELHCWISWKKTFSSNQLALWLQVLSSQSLNLCFPTKVQTIFNTTFNQHCTYPKDLNLNLEMMLNQIRVKQVYSKKCTRSVNWATRYSNAEVYKNYERFMIRFLYQRAMTTDECWFNEDIQWSMFNEIISAIWWNHDTILTKPVIVKKILSWTKHDLLYYENIYQKYTYKHVKAYQKQI